MAFSSIRKVLWINVIILSFGHAHAQVLGSDCLTYSFQWQSNDSDVEGQLHPKLRDWLTGYCKEFMKEKGYCEREYGEVALSMFVWLSTTERVVYEEMFTGSPHQLGVAIPNDLGYRAEKVETLKYINVMMVMKNKDEELIWNSSQSRQAKQYKTRNAEKRSKNMVKKLLKGIPSPSAIH